MARQFEIQEEKTNMISMCRLERVTGLRPTLTDRFLPKMVSSQGPIISIILRLTGHTKPIATVQPVIAQVTLKVIQQS